MRETGSMPRRWGRLATPLAAAGIAFMLVTVAGWLSGTFPADENGATFVVPLVAAVVAWGGAGALIGSRRPENPIGLVLAAEGCLIGFAMLTDTLTRANRGSALERVMLDLQGYLVPMLVAIPLLLVLFPTGRPPTPRWRVVVWMLGISIATGMIGMGLAPDHEVGTDPGQPWGVAASVLTSIAGFAGLAGAIAAVVSVVVRFRRSRGDEREQMRWLAFTAVVGAVLLVVVIATSPPGQEENGSLLNQISATGFLLTVTVGLPVAIGIAVIRHRLYDIDVVIKKALVALVLTLLIVVPSLVVFAAVSTSLTGIDNTTLALGGGVVIGALLWPALRLSRRIATRITFGRRATPYEVMTTFGQRVSESYSIEDVLPRLAQIMMNGTGASSARVLLRVGSDLREMAAAGSPGGAERIVPVLHQGEEVGALTVTFPANDPLTPEKERVIRDLATQAGLVLRNVRLIEDLRASRQRLVAAQDEERRRIERNLHDGVQQQLVALNVQLGLLARVAGSDPAKAGAMATTLQARASEALDDLRDLARGIYPPLLADKGLAAALEAQARKAAVPTTVASDGVGRYPQDVEAAVYFCVLETLNNVAKYASASNATVSLSRSNGMLSFEVRDDGVGFGPEAVSGGTGLQGMADRLEAIGGELSIESASGRGTAVRGRIPVDA